MKKLTGAVVTFLLVASTLPAQPNSLYTRPTVPSREVLDRLHLKEAWHIYLPTDGKRDGIFSIQMPERPYLRQTPQSGLVLAQQMFVQMRSGLVVALNPDTGATDWRIRFGNPYMAAVPLGFNSRSVFAVNGTNIYALDRRTGEVQWSYELPAAPAAPPTADEQQLYLALANGQLNVYELPDLDKLRNAPPPKPREELPYPNADKDKRPPNSGGAGGNPVYSLGSRAGAREVSKSDKMGVEPLLVWDYPADIRPERTTLLTANFWFLAGADGLALTMSKGVPKEQMRFKTEGPIVEPPGNYGDMAYLASLDNNLYAVNMVNGGAKWTYTTGTRILCKPEVTDDDVWVITARHGLMRVSRQTGKNRWLRPSANIERFLSVNQKFVYALDGSGRLVILDATRGTQLTIYDTRDYVVPVSNELNDRFFLAAHDGLLICLHDRDNAEPLITKTIQEKDVGGKFNPLQNKMGDPKTMTQSFDKTPFKDVIKYFSDTYNLPILISERAFKAAGVDNILDKQVTFQARNEAMPLGDHLKRVLRTVDADFSVQADHILIIPAAPKAKPPEEKQG